MTTTMVYRGEVVNVYMRKPPCPRDLGYWYCQECQAEYLEESSGVDHPIPAIECGKVIDGKVCGETHLGYEWCEDCQREGRTDFYAHKGDFEVVRQVREYYATSD